MDDAPDTLVVVHRGGEYGAPGRIVRVRCIAVADGRQVRQDGAVQLELERRQLRRERLRGNVLAESCDGVSDVVRALLGSRGDAAQASHLQLARRVRAAIRLPHRGRRQASDARPQDWEGRGGGVIIAKMPLVRGAARRAMRRYMSSSYSSPS